MNRLVYRQLRQTTGIKNPKQLELVLKTIRQLLPTDSDDQSAIRFIEGFPHFLSIVTDSYEHSAKHIELFAHSVDISSQEREEAHQKLLHVSRTDAMTELYNRGYWQERLHEEFARSQRYKNPVSLVILDIDRFKSINDQYGHPAGDSVITWTAKLLKRCSRGVDICGRYGGEEFAIILPGVREDDAYAVAERLRETIESSPCHVDDNTIAFTASAGVAGITAKTSDANHWLIDADKALYKAKGQGRNQVCIAQH